MDLYAGGAGLSISASGIQHQQKRIDTVAHNVANSNTEGFQPAAVEGMAAKGGGVQSVVRPGVQVDHGAESTFSGTNLGYEMANLASAKAHYKANAMALKAQSEAGKSIIDDRA